MYKENVFISMLGHLLCFSVLDQLTANREAHDLGRHAASRDFRSDLRAADRTLCGYPATGLPWCCGCAENRSVARGRRVVGRRCWLKSRAGGGWLANRTWLRVNARPRNTSTSLGFLIVGSERHFILSTTTSLPPSPNLTGGPAACLPGVS